MSGISDNFLDLGYMDTLASGDSPLHRLDPRAKLITVLVFIVTVLSFDKYALSALMPFFVFPAALIAAGGLPARYLLKKVMVILPVAAAIAAFNPLFDRQVIVHAGPIAVTGGWISFFSILVRFVLTVTIALVLVATTGFNAVCMALSKIGVPRPFVVQLLFLYRYLFVLLEEGRRLVNAQALRSFSSRPMRHKTFASLAGHLLLRTLERAQRIYQAMCCRGFEGRIRVLRPMRRGPREAAFVIAWSLLFVVLRFTNVSLFIGAFIMRRF